MRRIIVIGSGPAGLAAAFRLQKEDKFSVAVLEKEPLPGGRAKSPDLPPGFFGDSSAQFLSRDYKHTLALIREIGLENELVRVSPKTFLSVYENGRPQALSWGFPGLVATREMAPLEKARLSLTMGRTALQAKKGGHAGLMGFKKFDDKQLTGHLAPLFKKKATEKLLRAAIHLALAEPEDLSLAFAYSMLPVLLGPRMVLRKGIGSFTHRLAERCKTIRYGVSARSLVIRGGHVRGVKTDKGFLEADAVICATKAQEAAALLKDLEKERLFLSGLEYASCLQVLFGTETPFLPAWGVHFPEKAESFLTFVCEETFKSPERAPRGQGLTQALILGTRARELMHKREKSLIPKVMAEIQRLFPGYPEPLFTHIVRTPQASPVMFCGYLKKLFEMNLDSRQASGLFFIGDYQAAPSIEGAVALAQKTAEMIIKGL